MIEQIGGGAPRSPGGPAKPGDTERGESIRRNGGNSAEKASERVVCSREVDRLVRRVENLPSVRPEKVERAIRELGDGAPRNRDVLRNTARKIMEQNA